MKSILILCTDTYINNTEGKYILRSIFISAQSYRVCSMKFTFKAALINVLCDQWVQWLWVMWKGSLAVTNPQRIITQLCSSPQLYRVSQSVLANWFFYSPQLYCLGHSHHLHRRCFPATAGSKKTKRKKKVEHLAAKEPNVFLRSWWGPKQS